MGDTQQLTIGKKIPAFDWIIDNLYLGDIEAACSEVAADIGVIINASNSHYVVNSLKTVHCIDIDDDPSVCINEYFGKVCDIINSNPDTKILIHCQNGVSRSVTLVLCYLLTRNMNLRECILFLKSKRAFQYTRPNRGFFKQLLIYENNIYGSNSVIDSDYRRIF